VHTSIRKTSVAGLFYPSSCKDVLSDIKKFNTKFKHINIPNDLQNVTPRAILVPHAGYKYSGFTANMAYRFVKIKKDTRIIVIGPSHKHYFKGISASYYDKFETPCGDINIDSAYLFALAKELNICFEPKAHKNEHSTEVQMPFIKHYFNNTKVIELIYGDVEVKELSKIIYVLLQNPDNILIISSDLSHFHTLEVAKSHDNVCLKGIALLDVKQLENRCEACGLIGIKALVEVAKKERLSSKLLDYKTSADANGNKKSVVGYLSAIFY